MNSCIWQKSLIAIFLLTGLRAAAVPISAFGGADDFSDGATKFTDNAAALVKIKQAYPQGVQIDLPYTKTGVYYFGPVAYRGMDGFLFNPEHGVSIRAADETMLYLGGSVTRPLNFYLPILKMNYSFLPDLKQQEQEKGRFIDVGTYDDSSVKGVDCLKDIDLIRFPWPGGNFTSAPDKFRNTVNSVTVSRVSNDEIVAALVKAVPQTELTAAISDCPNEQATPALVARMVDGSLLVASFSKRYPRSLAPQILRDGKLTTLPERQIPFADTHSNYWLDRSTLSLHVSSRRSLSLLSNGMEIYKVNDTGADLDAVGFGGYGEASNGLVWSEWTLAVNKRAFGHGFKSGVVFGDSLSAGQVWVDLFRQNVEFAKGLRILRLDNFAVGGQTSAQQLAAMRKQDLKPYDFFLIMVGTNNIQGQSGVQAYTADLNAMIDEARKANPLATVVLGIPPLFYTRAQATHFGGLGQDSQNYDRGSLYRAALLQVAAARQVKVAFGTEEDQGPIVAALLKLGKEPVLRDNIHGGAIMQRMIADAFARSFLSALNPPADTATAKATMPSSWAMNGTDVSQAGYALAPDGRVNLRGMVAVKALSVPILKLPFSLRPNGVERRFLCAAGDTFCTVIVNPDGAVTIVCPGGKPGTINLDMVSYQP